MRKKAHKRTGIPYSDIDWGMAILQDSISVEKIELTQGVASEVSVAVKTSGLSSYLDLYSLYKDVEISTKLPEGLTSEQVGRSYMFTQNAAEKTNHGAVMFVGMSLLSEKLGSGELGVAVVGGKAPDGLALSVPYEVVEAQAEVA